ncbi:MAG: LemA family protein [Candidatus Pacebacteria bacterium]|nr:LemA family protein [Candidatus Paceibacterota bacterium]
MKKIFIGVGVVILFLIIFIISLYNGLISGKELVKNQLAQVETQYQRRFDLIPGLVASVKGVMNQEQSIFMAIADARTKYGNASTPDSKVKAINDLESSLSRLLVVMENYPQLKSSENVQTFMTQYEGTENRISVERKRYNDVVTTFNLKVKRFPTSIISRIFGFSPEIYFEAESGSEKTPKVEL